MGAEGRGGERGRNVLYIDSKVAHRGIRFHDLHHKAKKVHHEKFSSSESA